MMIHIVNEYDKLRYNFGLSDEDALNELMKKRGNELEPELLDQFFRMAQNNRL
jgi:HD-GYP domain-containing protein (c-di-GMP phosphodiesterase class II)